VIAFNDASGRWLLRLVSRAGSLDLAVANLRRRNLAISSTILALLAVSVGFLLVSTRRAQRLAAQQVEFVASVSHELRTPLSVIRSAGENLADGIVEEREQVRRYGALIANEGRTLGTMVEQVMEYAGLQSDQPGWRKEPVDVRAVVDEAVAGARRAVDGADAAIETVVPEDLPRINGDRAALVRAVQNLVENALKYGVSPDGRFVSVRVTGPAPEAGAGLRIEVADRGPGVDAGERRRIFEPFVRGRAAAAARVAGNGLGLSIVRRVAEAHGGRVEVRSASGPGAVFTLVLGVGNDYRDPESAPQG
jgi:signal transduction histidine kinase